MSYHSGNGDRGYGGGGGSRQSGGGYLGHQAGAGGPSGGSRGGGSHHGGHQQQQQSGGSRAAAGAGAAGAGGASGGRSSSRDAALASGVIDERTALKMGLWPVGPPQDSDDQRYIDTLKEIRQEKYMISEGLRMAKEAGDISDDKWDSDGYEPMCLRDYDKKSK